MRPPGGSWHLNWEPLLSSFPALLLSRPGLLSQSPCGLFLSSYQLPACKPWLSTCLDIQIIEVWCPPSCCHIHTVTTSCSEHGDAVGCAPLIYLVFPLSVHTSEIYSCWRQFNEMKSRVSLRCWTDTICWFTWDCGMVAMQDVAVEWLFKNLGYRMSLWQIVFCFSVSTTKLMWAHRNLVLVRGYFTD